MTMMLLTTIRRKVTRLFQLRTPSLVQEELHTVQQMVRTLYRERDRSDRSGLPFSLITFTPREGGDKPPTWRYLARLLKDRVRSTDEVGWLGPDCLGVVLPYTRTAGAWKVVDDILLKFTSEETPPAVSVSTYPEVTPLPKNNLNEGGSWPEISERVMGKQPKHGASHSKEFSKETREQTEEPLECASATRSASPQQDRLHYTRSLAEAFQLPTPLWKRILDVLVSGLALLLLAPFFALMALAIKLESRGPVFFRQMRSGLGGRPFRMWKFRSMVVDAEAQKKALLSLNEQDGPAFKMRRDPRVTRLGRILRATSIDELPQLWNVFWGDMTLVGPRPLPCDETAGCVSWQRRRLDVTPGLTCIWQIKGRSRVSFAEWARMDIQYIRQRSLWQDLKLLALTVPALLKRKGAC